MHHYPFHVGDYIRATAHLDIIEDCVYRRLIDLYMETEQPIPNETQQVIRRLRLGSSGLILETILNEFFTLEADNCWHNSRCDNEIREFSRLAEISRINGKLGGRPKKTQQVVKNNPEITQREPVGLQPIPNTQYPIPKEKTKALSGKPDSTSPKVQKPNGLECKSVLEYLNEKAGSNFKAVPANINLIQARFNEGATLDEMKSVIDSKTAEWKSDEKMSKYLRPDTLFNASKYASYAGQVSKGGATSMDSFMRKVGAIPA